jgi:hypothetical protein
MIEVRTQAELDRALADHLDGLIVCIGDGHFTVGGRSTVRAGGSSTVEAWDRSTVRAWDRSTVRAWDRSTVEAWDRSTVEAWDRSTVEAWDRSTVEAWDRSTVEAWDRSTVRAWGRSTVRAGQYNAVVRESASAVITGGVVIEMPVIATAAEWCAFHGLLVVDGVTTLFKVVGDDFMSSRGVSYAPGSTPEAKDWDPVPECGGGLHFSPRPWLARQFDPDGTRYVACPVLVDEIVVHPDGLYPSKVKAPRVVAPGCVECDADGAALIVAEVLA